MTGNSTPRCMPKLQRTSENTKAGTQIFTIVEFTEPSQIHQLMSELTKHVRAMEYYPKVLIRGIQHGRAFKVLCLRKEVSPKDSQIQVETKRRFIAVRTVRERRVRPSCWGCMVSF